MDCFSASMPTCRFCNRSIPRSKADSDKIPKVHFSCGHGVRLCPECDSDSDAHYDFQPRQKPCHSCCQQGRSLPGSQDGQPVEPEGDKVKKAIEHFFDVDNKALKKFKKKLKKGAAEALVKAWTYLEENKDRHDEADKDMPSSLRRQDKTRPDQTRPDQDSFVQDATEVEMAGYELVAILDTESEAIQDLADYERLYHRCMDLGFIMHKVRTLSRDVRIANVAPSRLQLGWVQDTMIDIRKARSPPMPPTSASGDSGNDAAGKGTAKGKGRKRRAKK